MSKKLLLSFPFLLFLAVSAMSQTPPCPDPPPPGANSCQQTCVYCDFDGYMGINNGTPSGGNTVCGAIAIHNDQWFGFIAGTSTISIDILTSNCQNGDGLQAAFFDDCNAADAIVCNPGTPGGGGMPLNLTYSGFVPGQTYYLMIDGWTADICDYEIDVTQGSVTPPPPAQAAVPIGPTQVCPGATVVYSIPPAFGAGSYTWTSPPGSSINGGPSVASFQAPEGTEITVTFGNLGGNICVTSGNACSGPNPPSCLFVSNQPIPPTVKPPVLVCHSDLPYIWDEPPFTPISAPGTYTLTSTPYDSYLGCDSVIQQTITVSPPISSNIGFQYICEGDCYQINGNTYCQPGTFQELFTSYQGCDSVVNFFVVEIAALAVIEQPVPSIDCNDPELILNSNGSSSGPNVTYTWSDVNWSTIGTLDTQIINNGGTYHLVVDNSGGNTVCSDTTEVTVIGNTDPPGVTASGGILGCLASNQTVTLTASSPTNGVNFSWSGPGITPANQNLQNPTVDTAGMYIVTVTNPTNACESIDTVEVIADNNPPTASAVGGTISCLQPSVTIDGMTNAGTASYQWSGPGINPGNETTEDPVVDSIGTYFVTITNDLNGCTNTATATVDQNTAIPSAVAGADQTITCAQGTVILTGNGDAGGDPIDFSWAGPGINGGNMNQQSPSVDQAGEYILTVTNSANGCANTDTVLVDESLTAPTASAGVDSILNCVVTSIELDGSGSSQGADFVVLWTGPDINAGNENLYNPQVSQSGTYTILVTNTTNGCTSTDDVLININTALPTADAGPDQTLTCATTNGVTLNGNGTPGGIEFLWTGPGIGANNETEQSPVVTVNGIYVLQTTNPVNGCAQTDTVEVFQDAAIPTADAGGDLTLNCLVNSVDIDASNSSTGPDFTYNWTGPDINAGNMNIQSPLGITTPGTYNLTVTNTSNNCINTDVLVVLIDTIAPLADGGNDLILNCFNLTTDTLDASASSNGANFSVLWTGPDINAGNQNDIQPVITLPGMYTVEITNTDNNCVTTDDVNVTLDVAAPNADAGSDAIIDCVVLNTTIGGASSSGPEFTYLWTGPAIDSTNQDQATPNVDLDGVYTIVVTNSTNGCTSTDDMTVTLNAVYPVAVAGADQTITCNTPSVLLDGTASSSGATFTYLWTGPDINAGNQNQADPTVGLPGTYIIQVTNTSNSCITTDTVEVAENTAIPAASAGMDARLDCQTTNIVLDGSASDTGAVFQYLWTGPAINAGNETLLSPDIDQPGTYTILVTNTDNGCTSTAQVMIDQDIVSPTASAGADLVLTCGMLTQSIDGSGSSVGADFEYVWIGPGINTGNFDQQNPMVSDSGTYVIIVTDIDNQCTATDTVFVDMNANLPIADAGISPTLTCQDVTAMLDGSGSASGPGFTYLWTGPGVVPGTETSITPTVNQSGAYTLLVTNNNNGCTRTDVVNVAIDTLPPTADAGTDQTITCTTASGVTISSLNSSSGPDFTILWSGPDINAGNETQPEPLVAMTGTYTLVVTNTLNGCTSSDQVVVDLDQTPPTVDAGPTRTINCDTSQVILDASGSQVGGTFDVLWSGPGINMNNEASVMPNVTEPGVYTVMITNTSTGCTSTDITEVFIDTLPPALTTTTDTITCFTPTGDISVTSSIPNTTFLWDGIGITPGDETLAMLTVNESAVYSVVATAPNGCTSFAEVIVDIDEDVPEGAVEGTVLNCLNGSQSTISAIITTPNATGSWTGPGNYMSDSLTAPVSTPGPYQFTITAANGCTAVFTANVFGDFAVPVAAAEQPPLLDCNTTSITINANSSSQGPEYDYAWTTTNGNILNGQTGLSPVVNQPGDYQLVITDTENGCTSSLSVQVSNDPSVPVGFELTVQDVPCFYDTSGFIIVNGIQGGTPPFMYSLNGAPASGTSQFTDLPPADYSLTMEDANGCVLDTVVNISSPGQLVAYLGDDQQVILGESVDIEALISAPTTPIQSVTWSPEIPCDSSDVTPGGWCTGYTDTPFDSYYQNITVVDSNGCVSEDRVLIQVLKDRDIYVANVFNPENNDARNHVLFIGANDVSVEMILSWNIYDRWGELVFSASDFLPGQGTFWDGSFNGKKLDPGVYVWVAEVLFVDGEKVTFSGDTAIVR